MGSISNPHVTRVDVLVGFYDHHDEDDEDPIALLAQMVSDAHPTVYVDHDQSYRLREGGGDRRWVVTRFIWNTNDTRASASVRDEEIREAFAREACYRGWFASIEGAVWRIAHDEFTTKLAGEIFVLTAFGKDPLADTGPLWPEEA